MIFIPLRKVDAAQRLVYGSIDETPDRAGDVFDYTSSKPQFQAWSAEMHKASGGQSLGNVRAMHGLTAAGKLVSIDYDDAGKAVQLCAKVVDDAEWQKVLEGVYTGFSPGGRFVKRWNDGAHTRYTAGPNEMSLVDMPCIPSATFTMIKADGGAEERAFAVDDATALAEGLAAVQSPDGYRALVLAQPSAMIKALYPDEAMRKTAEAQGLVKADYSADERDAMAKSGEAMPDGSFPIKSKGDVANAVKAHALAKNQAAAKAHIIKRAKALNATDALPEDWEGSTMKKLAAGGLMLKGLAEVAQLAQLMLSLKWLAECVTAEAGAERDGSPLPGQLAAWIATGAEILPAMATEESSEAVTKLKSAVDAIPETMRKAVLAMAKSGARNSKGDQDRIQAIHDSACDLGADCGSGMSKAAGAARLAPMAKLAGDLAVARGSLRKVEGERDAMAKRIAALEALPAPGGPRLRSIDRGTDIGAPAIDPAAQAQLKTIEAMPAGVDKTAALVRHAMENPMQPGVPSRLS